MEKYQKANDFYIGEDEESLIKHILPEHYIEKNLDKNKIDAGYAVNFLQNELNSMLNSFVNGGFSYRGFVFYPLIKDVSKENLRRIKFLKKIVAFLVQNGYDFSNSASKYRENINSSNFSSILSALYQDFSLIKAKNTEFIRKPACKELGIDGYRKADLGYLSPLKELKDYANNNLKQHLSGFYLHGSLATRDYIKGWSDADTLAIVSKETIENPKHLLELRKRMYCMRYFFYKIDPLQHHGSIVVSEYDLSNYCQPYFPIPVFKYAKSFFKEDPIRKVSARDYKSEALNKLFWFVNYFRKLNLERRYNPGSYDLKSLLHSITLFPTLYLQAKGILVYKKFSFDIAKKDFKKESWKVIDDVSYIRSKWKCFDFPVIGFASRINPLLYYQINSRIMDLFKDINKTNKIETKKIIENMFKLSEEAWSKVKENAKNKKL